MKTILLTLTIAASLMGQVATPPYGLNVADAKTLPDRTPLDAQEHDKLSNAYINYLGARVLLLEALGSSKAGTVDIQRAEQATTAFNATLADVQKKHGADGCMWDFGPKVWRCEK